MQYILFLCFIINFISCAPTDEVAIASAIREAKFHLSSGKCSKAKSILDDVSYQEDNADYVMVYSSMYACKAGYKELEDLFDGNLESIDSASFFNSLAAFTTSDETEEDSDSYTNLFNAIDTILSTTSGEPSTSRRNSKYGSRKSGDMSMQTLYMLMVQMGKYFALYGNAINTGATAGEKGSGSFGNICIYSYDTEDAEDFIAAAAIADPTITCNATGGGEGSDFLEAPETAANIKRRLCEGIYYYNNFIDILGNLTLPSSDSLGDLEDVKAALDLLLDAAEAAETGGGGVPFNDGPAASQDAIENLRVLTSLDSCIDQDLGRIQKWHAIFFETVFE